MTEFLARISARRPLVIIGLWIALTVIALLLSGRLLDSATTTEFRLTSSAESHRAAGLLESRLRGTCADNRDSYRSVGDSDCG